MADYGSNPAFNEYQFTIGNGWCQAAVGGIMPENGVITAVNFYAGGHSASVSAHGCVWDGSGNLLFFGTGVTLTAGSHGVGGQAWHTDTNTGVFVAAGTPIYIGWWHDPGLTIEMSDGNPSAPNWQTFYENASLGGPTSFAATSYVFWTIAAHLTYTPSSPPGVITQAATAITSTTATLNGLVNPNGLSTNYQFYWGTDPSTPYGLGLTGAGSGTSNEAETGSLTGLTPATTYYFVLAAESAAGNVDGYMLSFTTAGINAPTLGTPATGSVKNLAAGQAFTWTYNGGHTQLSYAFRRNGPSGYQWWNVTTSSWVGAEHFNTSGTAGLTFAAAQWIAANDGYTYGWNVATTDSAGLEPYAGLDSLVTCEGAPFAPTLLTPANNSSMDLQNLGATFTWTNNPNGTAPQTGYIFKRVTGGVTSYWTGSAFQSGTITVTSAVRSITFGSGLWVDGDTYTWTVATVDIGGTGAFA